MNARRLFERICERHGIESESHAEYVPLVERAIVSPEKVRDKILRMVEANLARRAQGDPTATFIGLERNLDEEVLIAVAERLHGWAPHWDHGAKPNEGEDPSGPLPDGLGGMF